MQLSYRGVRYSQLRESMDGPLDSIEMIDSGVQGSYRGRAFHFTYPRHLTAPTQRPTCELTYRGVSYRTTDQGLRLSTPAPVARPVVVPQSARSAASVSSFRKVNANVVSQSSKDTASFTTRAVNLAASEYNKIHQRHIQERLQRRIDAAKARGDRQLLHLLEREMQQVG